MPFSQFPSSIQAINPCLWATYEPYFIDLLQRPLTPATTRQWLRDWSDLARLIQEAGSTIYIEKSIDTRDTSKQKAFLDYINDVVPEVEESTQKLKERLLEFDPEQEALSDIPLVLRHMRTEAALFRVENVPHFTELAKLSNAYEKLTGNMSADWDGERQNLNQLAVHLNKSDRAVRRRAWTKISGLWLAEREALNELYLEMLAIRQQVAANAELPTFRDYAFLTYGRYDYTPADCATFHDAIAAEVVPAVKRIIARKQERLGYAAIRPWDWVPERGLLVDEKEYPPLRPFTNQDNLIAHSQNIFAALDNELGQHFATMVTEQLLDLETRPGKALGGYCSALPLRRRPFIFMNGVGIHDDVQTMLHEAGHAFHVFATVGLPLVWQTYAPMEFCEVASMAMELLSAPYLTTANGGFYSAEEAARARIEHLETSLAFLPYMAVVDAFQHWVYTHGDEAREAAQLDAAWSRIWQRYLPMIDYTGDEAVRDSGWHRKPHIFDEPFYYIEYGMALVGAWQVWQNSLTDHRAALQAYRQALALGGTRSLPELFAVAGADFRFDRKMMARLVKFVEGQIEMLTAQLAKP